MMSSEVEEASRRFFKLAEKPLDVDPVDWKEAFEIAEDLASPLSQALHRLLDEAGPDSEEVRTRTHPSHTHCTQCCPR